MYVTNEEKGMKVTRGRAIIGECLLEGRIGKRRRTMGMEGLI